MMIIKIIFNDLDLNTQDTPKVRGAVASKFPGYTLLHHHINGNRLLYLYPKIQYKIINHKPMIIGINEGIKVLKRIYSDVEELKINGFKNKPVQSEVQIDIYDKPFGRIKNSVEYKFESFWLALNEKNYQKYKMLGTWLKRKRMLERILVGNILSMSKGLGYTVPAPIEANINEMKEVPAKLKGTPMLGFLGTFSVNFEIPDYWGLGKSVSRGFGTVVRGCVGDGISVGVGDGVNVRDGDGVGDGGRKQER